MSVQFKLGAQDHHKVEDFVSTRPTGVGAIILDSKKFAWQERAADAARSAGLDVYLDPATERLASPGYALDAYPVYEGRLLDLDVLCASLDARTALVRRVLEKQPSYLTRVTAPHFYADNVSVARLNVELAEITRHEAGRPVRIVLTISNKLAATHAVDIAAAYVRAGVHALELRLSPFGGEALSLNQLRNGLTIARQMTESGLAITLGHSGNVGHVAVALGVADSYSVGVGLLETVNHKTIIARQKTPPPPPSDDPDEKGPRSAQPGVYLPGIAATVPKKQARALMDRSDLRLRLGCRTGVCREGVLAILGDVKTHYLHARAGEMTELLRTPERWRANLEYERLSRAQELRRFINAKYVPTDLSTSDVRKIGTRTSLALLSGLDSARRAS